MDDKPQLVLNSQLIVLLDRLSDTSSSPVPTHTSHHIQISHIPPQISLISGDMTKIKICPTHHTLVNPMTDLKCPYPNCFRSLSRTCSMVRHLQTHFHHLQSTPLQLVYYCLEVGCPYSMKKENGLSFKSLKYLRQHYRKIHSPKDFRCPNCDKSFATKTYLSIHERMCGISFRCSCDASFTSLEALQTHARRKLHGFDLQKYRRIISIAKKGQTERANKGEEKASELIFEPVKPIKTSSVIVPIFPKPSQEARVVLHQLSLTPALYIDYGTQTVPLLVRKRSATQHCQTESKSTKTTGTLTTPAFHNESSKPGKRKTSSQTQTKRLKISTETQTPVVTKRKRCTRKKQITTATTQTSSQGTIPHSSDIVCPILSFTEHQVSSSTPSILFSDMFATFDEVHSETQTDPNPFFGYRQETGIDPLLSAGGRLAETSETQTSSEGLKTIETQTSPMRKFHSAVGTKERDRLEFSPLDFYFGCTSSSVSNDGSVESPRLHEADLDPFSTYLETMDSETQTIPFETTFNQFLY